MTASSLSSLAQVATDTAILAAATYLRKHGLQAPPEVLSSFLMDWIKIKLPEALRDAKEAIDAGMAEAAQQTFLASMMQAGIEAAKESGFPPHILAEMLEEQRMS